MDTNMYSFNPIQEWVFPGLLTDRGGSGGGGGKMLYNIQEWVFPGSGQVEGGGGGKMLYNQSQNIWG